MKNATEFAKKFKTFRRKLPSAEAERSDHGVIGDVIYAHLLWNATSKQASVAYKKILTAAVDLNDVRMNHVGEIIEQIGVKYPQAEERAKRLRKVLNAIYLREHDVTVASLDGAGKRDIRDYFETLHGITPFVCNRVIAMCYGVAAIPVDERTHCALIDNGIVHEETSLEEVASWLVRQVKADEVCEVHVRLHAWAETQPSRVGSGSSSKERKKVVKKKVVKKKVAKKTATKKKVAMKKTKK